MRIKTQEKRVGVEHATSQAMKMKEARVPAAARS